jgi:uncharacterized protein YoxC
MIAAKIIIVAIVFIAVVLVGRLLKNVKKNINNDDHPFLGR